MRGLIQVLMLGLAFSFPLAVAAMAYPHLVGTSEPRSVAVQRSNPSPEVAEATDVELAPRRTARAFTEPPIEPTPTTGEARYSPLDLTPPPTVVAPQPTAPPPTPTPPAAASATPASSTVLAKAVVANTGGIGAKLRAAPVTGSQVGSLREGQTVDVLERVQSNGDEWLRVRTDNGLEGWVVGRATRIVDQPQPATAAQPTSVPSPASQATLTAQAHDLPMGGLRLHTVQHGDQLRHIAARYGVDMTSIIAINDIPNPDSLRVGQVLVIPGA